MKILVCFTAKYIIYPIIMIDNCDRNANEVIVIIDSPVALYPTKAIHNDVIITNNNGPIKFNDDLNWRIKNNPKKVNTGE